MRSTCFLLAIVTTLAALPAQEKEPRPLRFAWPTPARADVIETVPGTGVPTIELHYVLEVEREEPGGPRRVSFSDFRFERLGSDSLTGAERAQLAALLVPGLVTRPTLVVGDNGRVRSTDGYEDAARRMFDQLRDVAPEMSASLRTEIENQWLAEDARDLAVGRVKADWEAWVGAWVGWAPVRGEPESEPIELELPTARVDAITTLSVVPDLTLDEHHLRVEARTVVGGPDGRRAMQIVVDDAESARADRDGDEPRQRKVLRYELDDRVEAVLDRRTLLPVSVRVRKDREIAIEGEEPTERIEDRRFDFDWKDSDR